MKRQDNQQHRQQRSGPPPEQLRPGPERYFYGQWERRTQQKYRRATDYPPDSPHRPEQPGQHDQNYFAASHPYPHTVGDEGRYVPQHDMQPHDAWRPGEYVGWRENYPHQPARQVHENQYPVQHAGQPGDLARPAGPAGPRPFGGYGREAGSRYVEAGPAHSDYDPDYHQWRETQMRQFDEDYERWRKERYAAFAEEFNRWRDRQQGSPQGKASGGAESGGQHREAGATHPHIKDGEVRPNPENRATTGITSTKTE